MTRCLVRAIAVALVFGGLAAVAVPAGAERQLPSSQQEIQLSFAPLVKQTAPAVVNIFTTKTVQSRRFSPLFDDPFFRQFFGDRFGQPGPSRRQQNSLGSGVIVQPDGVIVTNFHVIEGADEITVVLADRREFRAEVLGKDERSDLAVLKIQDGNQRFPFLPFRDSDDLEVGDLVLAIGNPFGVGQTVTSGIVSALARTHGGINDLNFFIQTDAAINPGNSGGALVTMDGRLVGINTAIFSNSGGSVGIGFAIPSNMVRTVISGLASGGRVVRPWLGAEGQQVTPDLAASLNLDRPAGVLINGVHRDGPAYRAGLKIGDVILSIDGRDVEDPEALRFRITTKPVGDQAELRLWRGGRLRSAKLRIERPPESPSPDMTEIGGEHPLQGATVANLSPALADRIGAGLLAQGVVIMEIRRGTAAQRFRFQPGDIIRDINGTRIESVSQLKRILLRPADRWRITIERDGKAFRMVVDR